MVWTTEDTLWCLWALLVVVFGVGLFMCWLAGVKPAERKTGGYSMCKRGPEPDRSWRSWKP